VSKITSSTHLIQFLMGLNDAYDHIRNQILLKDPLPTVNKAYSMILRIDKQREIHVNFSEGVEHLAMFVKGTQQSKRLHFKKKDKKDRHCDYCNTDGHLKYACFKLHGYLDWYKELKVQKINSQGKAYANHANTPLVNECSMTLEKPRDWPSSFVE